MARAYGQFRVLAERTAAGLPPEALNNQLAIARLEYVLRHEVGLLEAVSARVTARAPLTSPPAVVLLPGRLHTYGGYAHFRALLARDPAASVVLDNPDDVATLLGFLREHSSQQLRILLDRDPAASVAIENPSGVANLLDPLRMPGPVSQVSTLPERDPAAQVGLNDPAGIARLIDSLRSARLPLAREQAAALARRAVDVPIADASAMTRLLRSLREAEAHDSCTSLAARLPAAGRFTLFADVDGHRERFRFGREPDGAPASEWAWGDM